MRRKNTGQVANMGRAMTRTPFARTISSTCRVRKPKAAENLSRSSASAIFERDPSLIFLFSGCVLLQFLANGTPAIEPFLLTIRPMETMPVKSLKVSKMAESLIGSEIIKLASEVKARMARGEEVYNLTIGDFDPKVFPIPEGLLNEIVAAYRNGETNYPPANGVGALREAVSAFLQRRQGLNYDPESILISGGARPIIYAIYRTLVDAGDRILYPVPSWNNNHYTHLSQGRGLALETRPEDGFMPTAALLEPHLKGTSVLALCSPLNPTGTTFQPEALAEICDLVLAENARRGPDEKPLYMIYDQIYWTLTFGETQHTDPVSLRPEMRDYTLFVDGMSKAFAATGVRVGWGFGPAPIIAKMRAILSHVGAWAPKAEQVASAHYLNRTQEVDRDIEMMKSEVESRLVALYEGFNKMTAAGFPVRAIAPEGAIYLTASFDLRGKTTASGAVLHTMGDVTQFLLEEAKLAIVPFTAFGSPSDSPWYRLSVGTVRHEQVSKILAHVENALAQLQ